MCQQIWAGVSPSLPIPKLTQFIQFVKSGQKIWAGPPLIWTKSKRTAIFFRETVRFLSSVFLIEMSFASKELFFSLGTLFCR